MRVLGLDPGTVTMGYGVVEGDEDGLSLVECGELSTPRKASLAQRLNSLHESLAQLISRLQPTQVAVEEPFVAKNARSALAVGQAVGVALVAVAGKGLPTYTYSPSRIKQAMTNYGHSGKDQVRDMLRVHLGLSSLPGSRDATDALAVAVCHIWESRWARRLGQEL